MTDLPDTAKKGGRTAWCVVACVTLCSLCSTNVAAAEEIPTRVLQRALSQAERVGTIDAVEVYGGTLEGAQQTLDPQAVPNSSGVGVLTDSMRETTSPGTQIDLVVAHGDFTDTFAKTPRYAEPPLGHIMAFAINPQTSWVLETYVGDLAPQTAEKQTFPLGKKAALSIKRSGWDFTMVEEFHTGQRWDKPPAKNTTAARCTGSGPTRTPAAITQRSLLNVLLSVEMNTLRTSCLRLGAVYGASISVRMANFR